ncbi:MAG: ABC transporter ATP-binding protein [Tissierellia bacterium]|nr:ABC transporter ATP-binding protein [Bacillota bacterium]NLL23489.1 ABC transporter ATP-binding protein [Tissierellia bacterium]
MKRILRVENLSIEFHDHALAEKVVTDLNLDIFEGEIVGLVGESGSGKSLTAMAAAGLLSRHDIKKSGIIDFDGTDMLSAERAELRKVQGNKLSVIFQEPMTSLNPLKKIGWQVEESMKIHMPEMTASERKNRALEVLLQVELKEPERVYNSYPHQLSGGMRQRVMIAAAMAITPKLLIADEPTTALDVTVQMEIIELLKDIRKTYGTSILFISHDLSLVSILCDRVAVMKNGVIVESGNVREIFDFPKHEYTKKLIASIPVVEL